MRNDRCQTLRTRTARGRRHAPYASGTAAWQGVEGCRQRRIEKAALTFPGSSVAGKTVTEFTSPAETQSTRRNRSISKAEVQTVATKVPKLHN